MALRDLLIAPREVGPEAPPAPSDAAAPRPRFMRRAGRGDAVALAASVGVLANPRDVRAVAVAIGIVIAHRHPAALVCVHAAGGEPHAPVFRVPARSAASRLAASLRAREITADARGKVALAELASGELGPATAATRALAVAGALPTVLAVASREPDIDALLATQDAILVAQPPSTDPALVELATASATALTPNAASLQLALDPASRTLALAGLRAPAAIRTAIEGLLA
jgi:hypothetical protein